MVSKAEFKRALVAAGGARVAAFERPTGDGWVTVATPPSMQGWRDVTHAGEKYVRLGDGYLDLDEKTTVTGGGDTFTVTWHDADGTAYRRSTYVLTQ